MRWTLISGFVVLAATAVFQNYSRAIAMPSVRAHTVAFDQSSARRGTHHGNIAEGEGLPPYLATGEQANAGNNILWNVGMAKVFSNYDSIWIICDLINNSERRFIFIMKNRPMIELTLSGKKPIRVPVSEDPAFQMRFFDRAPEPSKKFFSFRADLRKLVGKLAPGEYRLKLTWPSSSYAIEGLPGYEAKELVSPERTFQILSTEPGSVLKVFPQWELMIKRKDPPNPLTAGNLPRGVFTNTLKEPCEIPYYPVGPHGELTRPPLTVPLLLGRCVDKNGHGATVSVPAPQDLPMWKLQPGESVEIILPDWKTDGDGIYIYRLNVYIGKDKTRSLLGAVSEPFVIDESKAATKPVK